jgi:hypothetical protein
LSEKEVKRVRVVLYGRAGWLFGELATGKSFYVPSFIHAVEYLIRFAVCGSNYCRSYREEIPKALPVAFHWWRMK